VSEQAAESKSGASSSGSWSSPESHLTIEYPLELLDEIRLAVSSSFHANPRGGVEVGGVFFGTRIEKGVRIAAWRPISREHSYETSFILSEKDLVDLGHLVESATTDSLLKGLQPVGWFVPHARGSLELTESDLRAFNQFFPGEWQFTMVLQPGLVGPTKAAFFVRNADGKLCDHKPDREFTVEPLRAARVHGYGRRNPPSNEAPVPSLDVATERRDPPARVPRSSKDANGIEAEANLVRVRPGRSMNRRQEAAQPRAIEEEPARRPKKKWLGWLSVIPVTGFLIYAAVVARERLFPEPRPATLSLKLQDWPGAQLHLDWEKAAQPIQLARRGEIVFEDDGKTRTVELDAPRLRLGSFAYARRSGTVKVKLSVYGENSVAPAMEEMAEFNGPPPDDATSADDRVVWAKQKADLEAEIKRLRGQLATETARRQELQNLVRVLENRLHLTPAKRRSLEAR